MTDPQRRESQDNVTCLDCGYTAPLIGGLISLHEPDCPNVCEDDESDPDHDYDHDHDHDHDSGEALS